MENIERIKQMEEILDRHQEIANELYKKLEDFKENQEQYEKLVEYYYSEKYQEDLDQDDKGLFPEDLKRGVLSEDAIYNLMGDNYNLAIEMMELGIEIIKKY